MLNQVLLIGNVVDKPEIHEPKDKAAWADLVLGVSRSNQSEESDFIRLRLIGKLAAGAKRLNKGDLVYASGRLELSKYKTKSGDPAIAARVLVNYIQLISRKAKADVDQGQQSNG
jgi:single stranded DNA-binding protein